MVAARSAAIGVSYGTTMKISFFKNGKMTILKKTLLNRLKKEESVN
jgi:hypothetical protein